MTKQITNLKAEITLMKKENMRKINTLVSVYLKELNDLKLENNNIMQELLRTKHTNDTTLAIKEGDLEYVSKKRKLCQEEDVNETRECLIENAALMKELEIYKQKECNDCKKKTETKNLFDPNGDVP